jgi:dTDP-4-dehydrorhamnose reductase
LLVHYSTDYVFDGRTDKAYRESDPVYPLNVYGRTKVEGEAAVRAATARHLIFRSSWIYSARGRNFLHAIVDRARRGEPLAVVDDQIGTPTSAQALAEFTAAVLGEWGTHSNAWIERRSGTYHVTAQGSCSRYDFARAILARSPYATSTVTGIPSSAYPSSAARPTYSVLDCTRACEAFGLVMSDWRSQLDRVTSELFPARREAG